MPLKKGYSKKTVHANYNEMMKAGNKTEAQAWRVALDWGRVSYFKAHPKGFLPPHLRLPNGRRDRKSFDAYYGHEHNPVTEDCDCSPNPIQDRRTEINQGIKLYESFTGDRGELVGTYPRPKALKIGVVIGPLVGVAYEATRDGETTKYYHEFAEEDRPLLVSSPDGQQLIILGGEYDFTENGIVDASDEEYSPRYKR